MYKIKEVCILTGLSEKTVRFYVEQNLITPEILPGLHYRSYRFSEADVRRLQDIAALRSADFSVSEIKTMLSDPSVIPSLISQKENQLSERLELTRSALDALRSLNAQERTDYQKVADALVPREPQRIETPKNSRNRLFWLTVYVVLFLLLNVAVTGGRKPWLLASVLLLLTGIEFPIKAFTYFRYHNRWHELPNRTSAKIISVISDDEIERCWEPTEWDAIHDMLHVGFLHWSWICPDHWIPLVQFEAEGKTVTAAYRYGAFRNSWKPGQTMEIAWESGREQQIYPCGDPVIKWKAWLYLILGMTALAVSVILITTAIGM